MKRSTFDLTPPGWLILLATLVLVATGVACIYVTDTHYAAGHDGPANATKQFVRVLVSMAVGLLILRVGYLRISRHAYTIFLVSLSTCFRKIWFSDCSGFDFFCLTPYLCTNLLFV